MPKKVSEFRLKFHCIQHVMKLDTKTANEIDELKGKKQQLLIEKAGQEDAKRRIREMEDFLKK